MKKGENKQNFFVIFFDNIFQNRHFLAKSVLVFTRNRVQHFAFHFEQFFVFFFAFFIFKNGLFRLFFRKSRCFSVFFLIFPRNRYVFDYPVQKSLIFTNFQWYIFAKLECKIKFFIFAHFSVFLYTPPYDFFLHFYLLFPHFFSVSKTRLKKSCQFFFTLWCQ